VQGEPPPGGSPPVTDEPINPNDICQASYTSGLGCGPSGNLGNLFGGGGDDEGDLDA
jgi:hypothetical protein